MLFRSLAGIFAENREADVIVPVDRMFTEDPMMRVKEAWEIPARNGNVLPEAAVEAFGRPEVGDACALGMRDVEISGGTRVRLYDKKGRFIALYKQRKEAGEYHLEKMFFPEI